MATFYIEAIEATQIALVRTSYKTTTGNVKYGVDDPNVPNTYNVAQSSKISLSAGQKCYWTITSTSSSFSQEAFLKFTSTGRINVGGNLSDLIGGESLIPRNYCFMGLFYDCDKLVDASDLVLVNDFNSKHNCYHSMFNGCTALTAPPELPATTLTEECYWYMFYGCTSLTTAPELPATTLAERCYYGMFYGCTALTAPPELPATILAEGCYYGMFMECTSLKLSTTQTDKYKKPFRIPTSGTGTTATNALSKMFYYTGGTFAGTPSINTTYYLWQDTTPITITYKGQQLAEFDTGSKTLNCNGKYMEDNVTVTRESGTATITYNGTQIATVTDGSKTLNCAGKAMASDVVVTMPVPYEAYTARPSGTEIQSGISGLSAATLKNFANAISTNNNINSNTEVCYVWVTAENGYYTISIGDQISWMMNGTSYPYRIMGFNHYDKADGTGKAGILFQMVDCFNTKYPMKPRPMSSADGWDDSDLRTTLNSTLYGYLPSDVQSAISQVTIKTVQDVSTSTIITTNDKLFVPAEVEVFGSTKYAKGGTNEGVWYPWYKANNNTSSRTKKVNVSATHWWVRSPYNWTGGDSCFCRVTSGGVSVYDYADNSYGAAPCFCF